jgi:hypothetical protein
MPSIGQIINQEKKLMASAGMQVAPAPSIEIEPIKCEGCKGQFQQIQDMDTQLIKLQGEVSQLGNTLVGVLKSLQRIERELLGPTHPHAKEGQRNLLV